MISDVAIISADGCPAEIAAWADRPWYFLGEQGPSPSYPSSLIARCGPCNRWSVKEMMSPSRDSRRRQVVVDLPIYRFVNDDMLEILIWIGQCHRCQSVYWTRQGPPYSRLRYRSPATA